MADGLQGLSTEQILIQLLSRHAWLVAHSKSEEQPIGSGSPRKSCFEFKLKYIVSQQSVHKNQFHRKYQNIKLLLILSHRTSPLPV